MLILLSTIGKGGSYFASSGVEPLLTANGEFRLKCPGFGSASYAGASAAWFPLKKAEVDSGFHSPAATPRFLASACESGPAHQKTHQVSYPHLPQLERTNAATSQ